MTKLITITAMVNSHGEDWPKEEMDAITKFFEERGYQNISSGKGDSLSQGGSRWWSVSYEKKIE